ncbi:MAG: zinc-ribbon domain-containing protein [Desulfovibrio sp.]|nr:zinc-ribbon domain-containing protein [Desulfovibrio sp.]
MRITCTSCNRELTVPDNKLPDTPRFKIKCPQCKKEIVVERMDKVDPSFTGASYDYSGVVEPEVFPPGARVAFLLIVEKSWRNAASAWLKAEKFYQSTATNAHEAMLKLRLNDYQLVMIEDRDEYQGVLAEIGTWPGLRRRTVNLVLLGNDAASLDPQLSFRRGANTYLNLADAARCAELMDSVLKGYEMYYQYLNLAHDQGMG